MGKTRHREARISILGARLDGRTSDIDITDSVGFGVGYMARSSVGTRQGEPILGYPVLVRESPGILRRPSRLFPISCSGPILNALTR